MSETPSINDLAAKTASRRTVIKAAAWAAPVIAVAAAAPLAVASVTFDSPTAFLTGTLSATGTSATARSAVYTGGNLSYDSAGAVGMDSGTLTITLYNAKTASWSIADLSAVVAAYQTAGWVLVGTAAQGLTVFTHPPISNGSVISMPAVTWNAPAGSTKPDLGITVSSDSDDVSGQGLRLT